MNENFFDSQVENAAGLKLRTLFISHGGGPLPLLGDPGHGEMVEALKALSHRLIKPKKIILVSAHWEAEICRITGSFNPGLLYDYYGFPPESYDIQYPCSGHPELAQSLQIAGHKKGMKMQLDEQRGFDHGLFVPLALLFPEADVAALQVSLNSSLNPQEHLDLGRVIHDVMDEDTLLIGSGFSFHNMRSFFSPQTPEQLGLNAAFETWLNETIAGQELSLEERLIRLNQWANAPGARYCHPREEHLMPLHVCFGAEMRPATSVINLKILGVNSSFYLWEDNL